MDFFFKVGFVSLLPEILDVPVLSYFIYVSIWSHTITQYFARRCIPGYTRYAHIQRSFMERILAEKVGSSLRQIRFTGVRCL